MAVLIDLKAVSASRPGRPLFADLSLTVHDGDRIGIVGLNGCGKSTLLRIMAGETDPDSGQVLRGRNTRLASLDQRPRLTPGSVAAAVGDSWEAAAVLDRLGMTPFASADVATLSGGQAKRVALARTLVTDANLLVLDEPTNHLDIGAIGWLEERLGRYRGGLVLVSHDRHLLDRLTTRMVELDRGRSYVHEGGYAAYLEAKAVREEQAAAAESTRRNLARRELAWLRRGAPARTRKPQARIDSALAIIEARPQDPARVGALDLDFGRPRLGNKVIDLCKVSFSHKPDGPPLLRDIELSIGPGDRLGLVGPNGSGKSSLLDVMAGRRAPTSGKLELGPTVRLGYYDQLGSELDERARVREVVAGPARVPGSPEDNRLMDRFWFKGELQWATVGTLSGGERRRLQLLSVLAAQPNVLLLDEPTNDLDLDTLRVLEDLLEDWPGALVVVSHDRAFLERTVVDLRALDDSGRLAPVPGGLAEWLRRVSAGGTAATGAGQPTLRQPTGGGTGGEPHAPPGDADGESGPRGAASPRAGGGALSAPARGGRSRSTIGFQLRETERLLRRLEARRDKLVATFEAAADHRDMAAVGSELAEVQVALIEAEEQWLALAEEAEG